MVPDNYGEGHMSDLEIAAYLDHGLPPNKMDEIEEHLARCPACRDNVVSTQAFISRSRRSQRLTKVAAVLLAAAAITVVAVPSIRKSNLDREAMRSEETVARLRVYGPIGETKQAPERFMWGSDPTALTYHVTITTKAGADVWSGSSSDTSIVLPSSVILTAGERYLWVVDAMTNDGTTRSTGIREFGIVR
jgi:anti-sigma factor RsiW